MKSGFKNLQVYQKAFNLAMEIFSISVSFPKEEKYSLTDQIRRSARSVCANFAEAFRRRKYPAYFLSRLTDADAENTETEVWLDFALACNYINTATHNRLVGLTQEVGRLIGDIFNNPGKYGGATAN